MASATGPSGKGISKAFGVGRIVYQKPIAPTTVERIAGAVPASAATMATEARKAVPRRKSGLSKAHTVPVTMTGTTTASTQPASGGSRCRRSGVVDAGARELGAPADDIVGSYRRAHRPDGWSDGGSVGP